MTEKEKRLLLKDLCGRLPYNVKGRVFTKTSNGDFDINGDMIFIDTQFVVVLDQVNIQTEEIRVTAVGDEKIVEFIDNEQDFGEPYCIEDFKTYLRPMSSMTEEELNEIELICDGMEIDDEGNSYCYQIITYNHKAININTDVLNWLNAHHFDYCGLIDKGLALEAPQDMYNI